MKKIFIILAVLLFVLTGIWFSLRFLIDDGKPIVCTQDTKLCLDGSYIGRVGPNCEFAPCPEESEWLTIKQAIVDCEVEKVWQTHARKVGVKLKNGEGLIAIEPKLDNIVDLVIAVEPQCGKIEIATE